MLAATLASLAGFGTGLAGPSRDMLIKRAAPPGATGRVYGTVYSGLDLGFTLAAPVFGALLDHMAHPRRCSPVPRSPSSAAWPRPAGRPAGGGQRAAVKMAA